MQKSQMSEKPKTPLLYRSLKTLLSKPIVIGMWGDWESGKTDASLLMGYLSLKWKLIDRLATNIWTFQNPHTEYIYKMSELRAWFHADESVKLYILDEGLKHAYRRKAMSEKNVGIITELLPELGHGNGRIIAISQIAKLDSDIIHPAFMRAEFRKLSKKVMIARSKHWQGTRRFKNVPKSPIGFSRKTLAKFVIDKPKAKMFNSEEAQRIYDVCSRYLKGSSIKKIGAEFDMHQETVRRDIKKGLGWFVKNFDGFDQESREAQR
jgi:hypothetical protein